MYKNVKSSLFSSPQYKLDLRTLFKVAAAVQKS